MASVMLERSLGPGNGFALTDRIRTVLEGKKIRKLSVEMVRVEIPPEATRKGVSENVYNAYRMGLVSSCADVVAIKRIDGAPHVLLAKRNKPPFGGNWWIQGGVIFNFRPVHQFLLWKFFREAGMFKGTIDEFVEKSKLRDDDCSLGGVHIIGCFRAGRTFAEDTAGTGLVCDTINLTYLALVTRKVSVSHDSGNEMSVWARESELDSYNLHWGVRASIDTALELYHRARKPTHSQR